MPEPVNEFKEQVLYDLRVLRRLLIDPACDITELATRITAMMPQPAYAGISMNAVAATASIGNDPPTDGVVITAPLDPTWETFGVAVVQAVGESEDVYAEIGGGSLNIYLGTDENGDPDGTKNTPELIAAAIEELPGWSATFSGTTALTEETVELTGYTEGTPARLGRIAVHENSIWIATKDDNTITQDGWVKIYEPET